MRLVLDGGGCLTHILKLECFILILNSITISFFLKRIG